MEEVVIAVAFDDAEMSVAAATKNEGNLLKINGLISDTLDQNSVLNGAIFRSTSVAGSLSKLLKQLCNTIDSSLQIDKIFVVVGSPSLRTHVVTISESFEKPIALPDLDVLNERVLAALPSALHKFGDPQLSFTLNGRAEQNPVGKMGLLTLDAAFVVADVADLQRVENCVHTFNSSLEVNFVAATSAMLQLADNQEETIFVNFEEAQTLVGILSQNRVVVRAAALPFGRKHIVADLMSFGLDQKAAHDILKPFVESPHDDGMMKLENFALPCADVNRAIACRLKEIVSFAVAHARVSQIKSNELLLAGTLTNLANFGHLVSETSEVSAKTVDLSRFFSSDTAVQCDSRNALLVGALLAADENCVSQKPASESVDKKPKTTKSKGIKDKLNAIMGKMFDEQTM